MKAKKQWKKTIKAVENMVVLQAEMKRLKAQVEKLQNMLAVRPVPYLPTKPARNQALSGAFRAHYGVTRGISQHICR